MADLEGRRFRDPHAEKEFVVTDAPESAGVSTFELDQKSVTIEYDDGDVYTVPHERFRGANTYEEVVA